MNKDEYYEKSIEELKNHARVANEEMGEVKNDIGVIKNDIVWMKETTTDHIKNDENAHKEISDRLWWIMTVAIFGTLVTILSAIIIYIIK